MWYITPVKIHGLLQITFASEFSGFCTISVFVLVNFVTYTPNIAAYYDSDVISYGHFTVSVVRIHVARCTLVEFLVRALLESFAIFFDSSATYDTVQCTIGSTGNLHIFRNEYVSPVQTCC